MLLLILIIFALAGGTLAALAYENISTLSIDVRLTIFGWHSPAVALGVLILLSCVLGALLLYVVTLLSAVRERREMRRLRRRLAELEAMQAMMAEQRGQQGQMDVSHQSQQPQTAHQMIVPMPGTQTYRLQYLFPPPPPKRE
ncbi:MAG TPA: lipopolysaccharide assembly protein LapA domain-containing protein [Ktedonobacteraceae bacterium]|nr:lipopolysaccharide assembly protein LapA domain-containing protein [Ktedonobacteraceae bacterium]